MQYFTLDYVQYYVYKNTVCSLFKVHKLLDYKLLLIKRAKCSYFLVLSVISTSLSSLSW